jgi:hypothetical protein
MKLSNAGDVFVLCLATLSLVMSIVPVALAAPKPGSCTDDNA